MENLVTTKIEETIINGEVFSRKEIKESPSLISKKEKKILGLKPESFWDVLLKFIGLAGIVISILQYNSDTLKEAKSETNRIRKDAKAREEKLLKDFRDSFLIERDYNRQITELEIDKIKINDDKASAERDFYQKDKQFNQSYINQLALLQKEFISSRRSEFIKSQYELNLNVIKIVSRINSELKQEKLTSINEFDFNEAAYLSLLLGNKAVVDTLNSLKQLGIKINRWKSSNISTSAILESISIIIKKRFTTPVIYNETNADAILDYLNDYRRLLDSIKVYTKFYFQKVPLSDRVTDSEYKTLGILFSEINHKITLSLSNISIVELGIFSKTSKSERDSLFSKVLIVYDSRLQKQGTTGAINLILEKLFDIKHHEIEQVYNVEREAISDRLMLIDSQTKSIIESFNEKTILLQE